MRNIILMLLITIAANLNVASSSAGDFKDLFDRAARVERTIYQMDTSIDIMFFLLAEDYKKEHGIEAYYNAIFTANSERCIACGREYEEEK